MSDLAKMIVEDIAKRFIAALIITAILFLAIGGLLGWLISKFI